MKTISNEEKARELAKKICWDSWGVAEKTSYEEYYDAAMQMAAWKEEQLAKEKQQLIDKLEDWLANNICNAYNFRGDDISETFMNDCIKAMEGE